MTADEPLVSILMTAYHRPHYFKIALESALAQTYRNLEIIVCDNSTDDSVSDAIDPYLELDERIHYHRNFTSLPVVENFRQCLRLAQGEYVSYLMDDDAYAPDKIERMVALMEAHPSVTLVTSYRQIIDGDGQPIPDLWATKRVFNELKFLTGQEAKRLGMERFTNYIGETTTPLFRRADIEGDAFGVWGGQQYQIASDFATWFHLLSKGDMLYIPEALNYFRYHADQHQKRIDAIIEGANEFLSLTLYAYSRGDFEERLYLHALQCWREGTLPLVDIVQSVTFLALRPLRSAFLENLLFVQKVLAGVEQEVPL